jgi:cell division protein FtsX
MMRKSQNIIILCLAIAIPLLISGCVAEETESKVEIWAYVGGEGRYDEESRLAEIEAKIRALSRVENVSIVTPEEGLHEFLGDLEMSPEDILQRYGSNNFLPYKLIITISDAKHAVTMTDIINAIEGVHNVTCAPPAF